MPFTYLSHQAPAVGLKLLRPRWFDGTALVIGSMAPDFGYAFAGTSLAVDAHSPLGLVLFCVPVTLVVCFAVRRRVAAVAFAQLPDTPLRLHDFRVLARRHPALVTTAVSALVGAATHALWDTFTHDGRWGTTRFEGLRHQLFVVRGTSFSVAKTLQYTGHVVGAAVTIGLLWWIADQRLLARWYGRAFTGLEPVNLTGGQRRWFWALAAAGLLAGIAWSQLAVGGYATDIVRASLGLAAGVLVASVLARCQPRVVPAVMGKG